MSKDGQAGEEKVICPYCGDAIDMPLVICVDCRTPHHEDCFRENGLCTIYACGSPTFGKIETDESFVKTLALPAHCSVENNLESVTLGKRFVAQDKVGAMRCPPPDGGVVYRRSGSVHRFTLPPLQTQQGPLVSLVVSILLIGGAIYFKSFWVTLLFVGIFFLYLCYVLPVQFSPHYRTITVIPPLVVLSREPQVTSQKGEMEDVGQGDLFCGDQLSVEILRGPLTGTIDALALSSKVALDRSGREITPVPGQASVGEGLSAMDLQWLEAQLTYIFEHAPVTPDGCSRLASIYAATDRFARALLWMNRGYELVPEEEWEKKPNAPFLQQRRILRKRVEGLNKGAKAPELLQ